MPKIAAVFVSVLVVIGASADLITMKSAFTPALGASTCVVPRGSGPGYNASIDNQQNGKTVCLTVGERLLVVLSAGAPNVSPWRRIQVSKPAILQIAPLTLMFTRGTTGTNFKAVHLGTVALMAERSACAPAPSGTATCDAIQLWRVTIIVRAAPSALPKPTLTGIYGSVSAGPTCPVEKVGQPCPPRLVVTEVEVRGTNGKTIAVTHTDVKGRYAVWVRPGRYELIAVTGTTFPRCPNSVVEVTSGPPRRTDINCDTGIR